MENVIHELCGKCSEEVEIKESFEVQICPSCKESIYPCSMCDMDRVSCNYCPLDLNISKEFKETVKGKSIYKLVQQDIEEEILQYLKENNIPMSSLNENKKILLIQSIRKSLETIEWRDYVRDGIENVIGDDNIENNN